MSVIPTEAAGVPLPVLRLLAAPLTEPPFDDDLPGDDLPGGPDERPLLRLVPPPAPGLVPPPAPGLVPLPAPDLVSLPAPGSAPSAAPRPGTALRLVGPTRGSRAAGVLDEPRPRTPTDELPSSAPFARALVQLLLEVRAGARPLPQLQRHTTPALYGDVERALRRRPRTQGLRPSRADVRSVHVQDRPDGVSEVCATVRRGDRLGALALRLEGVHGRWVCTTLVGL